MKVSLDIRGDLFGGITAAIVALPLALAFGVASGAGALAGLYGAIAVGFFAALFGGTPTQISGPTGPMTVVMAGIVLQFAGSPGMVFTVVMLAGALQILFGLARFGRFIKLVPHPVVSGFMSGIGVIVIILQLAPLLGHAAPEGSNLVKLAAFPAMLARLDPQALALGILSFSIVMLTPPRLSRWVPAPLLAILAGTLAGIFLLPAAPVIGAIPAGLPSLHLPVIGLAEVPDIVRFALVLAFLGSVDSLLTSLVADSMTRTRHDSNRELIGQGLGNIAAGLCGGIAGAGATMRTLVNIRSGGRSGLSGAVHALVLLLLVLAFSGAAARIPLAVLGGILLKVGIDIIDWRNLRRAARLPP